MYLFTRAGRFAAGSIREAPGFVTAITEKVRQETGLDVHPWASMLSPDVGTTVWATFLEDLGQFEEATEKVAVSSGYAELMERGSRLLTGEFVDGLAQIVAGEPDPSERRPIYVTTARATAANGRLGAALAVGVEIAETATRITGARTMFLVDVTGEYGGCRWTSGFSDISELEGAESALMADEEWLALIDRAGASFAPGARQTIYRRMD